MVDDIHPDAAESRPDDHQRAIEAGEHAVDALENGDLSHAHALYCRGYARLIESDPN